MRGPDCGCNHRLSARTPPRPLPASIGYPLPMISRISERFRGFLPVVVDLETGGFDCSRHALLEIAAVPIGMDASGRVFPGGTITTHVDPFPGAEVDPKSLEVTGIDIGHPFRDAKPEKVALDLVFAGVRAAAKAADCQRAILVGHNAHFDLGFLNAAIARTAHKRSPFHPFSVFDTVTLAGVAFGQTVLSRALAAAGLAWNGDDAHSAVYDAERTAELFCLIVNRWPMLHAAAIEAPLDLPPTAAPQMDSLF
jgi:ribonuclease T